MFARPYLDRGWRSIAELSYTYQWDAFGMMTRMLGAGNDNTHLYTADDERLWTIDFALGLGEAGSTQTFRLRDSDAKVLREYRLAGTNIAGHWSQTKDYLYRDAGLLLASVSPAGTVHYTLDHLGTPRLATNSTGAYVSDHHYYAYGEELNPNSNETKKFTGHERDFNEAGQGTTDDLDYMHARFHSPVTGRFLTTDVARSFDPSEPQTWNRYAYARSNPMNAIDPDGQVAVYTQEHMAKNAETRAAVREKLSAIPLIGKPLAFVADAVLSDYLPTTPAERSAQIENMTPLGPGLGVGSSVGRLGTKLTSIFSNNLTRATAIAAGIESKGGVVAVKATGQAFNHVAKFEQSHKGATQALDALKGLLAGQGLTDSEKAFAQFLLSKYSKELDRIESLMKRAAQLYIPPTQ